MIVCVQNRIRCLMCHGTYFFEKFSEKVTYGNLDWILVLDGIRI